MLLIIHAGLHKTASTYLQNVLRLNRAALRAGGIYYELDAMLPANHGTAWMALLGDHRHAEAHVRQAVLAECRAMILSSEDFEGLIFDPARAAALETLVRGAGATQIEWHFCLRDPGDYLESMYAQLSRHNFVDYASMAMLTLRDGRFRLDRNAKSYPRAWEFCFDHGTHLRAFAKGVSGSVVVHDFADADPFPAHGVLERLGALNLITTLPGPGARNPREPAGAIAANLLTRIDELVASSGLTPGLVAALKSAANVSPALQKETAAAVSAKFRPGMEALLAAKVLKGGT